MMNGTKMRNWVCFTDRFIRSTILSITMAVFTIFYSFLCVCAFPLPLRYRYKMILFWAAICIELCRIITRINYQVTGLENIPRNRSGVILSKHQAPWETFFLPRLFHQPAIVTKRELLWVPFFGWGFAIIEPIAINRGERTTAMHQIIEQGRKCLQAGRWVLMFPEGTRIPVGQVGNYRLGGARLAVATGAPVIPVALNSGNFWPWHSFLLRPGTIQVVIGPVIETQNRTSEEVLAQAKNWIEETMLKINK